MRDWISSCTLSISYQDRHCYLVSKVKPGIMMFRLWSTVDSLWLQLSPTQKPCNSSGCSHNHFVQVGKTLDEVYIHCGCAFACTTTLTLNINRDVTKLVLLVLSLMPPSASKRTIDWENVRIVQVPAIYRHLGVLPNHEILKQHCYVNSSN